MLARHRDGLVARARVADHRVAERFHERFQIHGDDRLVLDDENARGDLLSDLACRLVEEVANFRPFDVENFCRVLVGKALDRRQQKRLAGGRGNRLQPPLRRPRDGRRGSFTWFMGLAFQMREKSR